MGLTRRNFIKFLAYGYATTVFVPGAIVSSTDTSRWKADPAAGRWIEIDVPRPLELCPISGDEPLTFGEEELLFKTKRVWKEV